MPLIHLETRIRAERELVFDLARNIDLHQLSTAQTNETAVGGTTSGLIGPGEWVTWRARHFGVYQTLTVRITEYDRPGYFVDEMVRGAFKRFRHEHRFAAADGGTVMTDLFDYTSPLAWLGRVADRLFLERYMRDLLVRRNAVVKEVAEKAARDPTAGHRTTRRS
ncbi:ligand-binding SRPBCC domain-containing protein [Neolewinella xylanilytica]|uniref:Ligand-binding SRPBCC domain-containing protein n=1 Tax=Neolewinella xylanilytica TaxID=1514080 RepID=A0A2S6I770_9BACT|nr:SRPBCC family protein [Neolewinella xylanilytica]PPK87362.1 ligand-binding SRPBCC domain-containing protein [Neolewinella xylanilytica]